MPIHDWTLVNPGTFHHFHSAWIVAISDALNEGLLPSDYYAMAEQVAGEVWPDVLTLKEANGESHPANNPEGGIALATAPPRVQFTMEAELDEYVKKQNRLVIRHSSDDEIIALVEIVSPGNKKCQKNYRKFLEKAVSALGQGYHLLLIDLFPPTARDPQGLHSAMWCELEQDAFQPPADKPLTLAAYTAGLIIRAYVEPVALAQALPDMPLFLDPGHYVLVPLEKTYQAAWRGVPNRWKRILEAEE